MARVLSILLTLAVVLARPSLAVAGPKFFGYAGSEYIGSNPCSSDATCMNHVNVVWIEALPNDHQNTAAKIATAASAGKKVVLFVYDLLFAANPIFTSPDLRGDYTSQWSNLVSALGSQSSNIVAFYHFDEPFWHAYVDGFSATALRDNINTVNDLIHSNFPSTPIAVVFQAAELLGYNPFDEARPPVPMPGGIPTGYDWLGWDCYGSFEACGGQSAQWYVSRLLTLRASPGQRLIFIPDGFLPPSDQNVAALLDRVNKYYNLALATPEVVGIFPYVWSSYSVPSGTTTGTRDLPTIRDRYTQIGQATIVAASSPIIAIDAPVHNSTVGVNQSFLVGGWTVDQGALVGPGVDAVHIYAYPWAGFGWGSPTVLGVAAINGARWDVEYWYGRQTLLSGYNLVVGSGLLYGDYMIVVYAHSTVTGAWNANYVYLYAR